ncbi:hypothetical protein PIB30_086768 [Stylosanthes scabra]|uniref:Uncharacterized protein n=1 Tax=Stylosanthes scabra TaxID=79078 RepID=A0ABU6YS81_9FABA|nr:hypothetical protein [Stylosanthes scabra]
MTQGHVWSTLEMWPKRDSLRRHQEKATFWARRPPRFQALLSASKVTFGPSLSHTWPKCGSPNPSPRVAEFQRSVNDPVHLPVESQKLRKDFGHQVFGVVAED